MVHTTEIMEQITHTKVYSYGAVDILKQYEIQAKIIDGALGIKLDATKVLVVVAEGDKLRFHIESIEPIF